MKVFEKFREINWFSIKLFCKTISRKNFNFRVRFPFFNTKTRKFRQIDWWQFLSSFSIVKMLISRKFWEKSVIVKCRNFYAVSHLLHTVTKYTKMSTQKNKMLLTKNPQFLPNQADILPSELVHWTNILTKFRRNWTKNVEFLVIASYFPGWTFFWIWSQCDVVTENSRNFYTMCLYFARKKNKYFVISFWFDGNFQSCNQTQKHERYFFRTNRVF